MKLLYKKYVKLGLAFLLMCFIVCESVSFVYATEDSEKKDNSEELDRLEEERQETLEAIDDLKRCATLS